MNYAFSNFRCLIVLLIITFSLSTAAVPKKKKPLAKPTGKASNTAPAATPNPRRVLVVQEPRVARYRINSLVGLNIISGSGLLVGTQFGLKLKGPIAAYVGPELNFTLLSGGHLFNTLAGGWLEFMFPSPALSLHLGAVGGVGFAEKVPSLPSTSLVVYFDAAIAQDVDDLITIRGQVRPGIVAGKFAFMMNFNVGFRLY